MDTETTATENLNEREIGGVMYKSRPLAFSAGLPILKRLIDIVAPLAAAALRGPLAAESLRSSASRASMLVNVLDVLPSAFTVEDMQRFAQAFGGASHYMNEQGQWVPLVKNAKVDNQEIHFTGRYLEFVRWLIFNVEVNFAGFFGGATTSANGVNPIDSLIAMVAPKTSQPSASGTTSSSA